MKGCTEKIEDKDEEDYYMHRRYESLCRGELSSNKQKEIRRDRRYTCGYIRQDPSLIIKPIKYEIISTKPEVRLIYEMASTYETKVLRRLAFPQVRINSIRAKPSQVRNFPNQAFPFEKSRALFPFLQSEICCPHQFSLLFDITF